MICPPGGFPFSHWYTVVEVGHARFSLLYIVSCILTIYVVHIAGTKESVARGV